VVTTPKANEPRASVTNSMTWLVAIFIASPQWTSRPATA
jgi:hypothetical protein